MSNHNKPNHKESGATIIVCLVILAVMTVLGLASIRSSNLEIKMSASQRDHSVAFQTAESALLAVEKLIMQNPKRMEKHFSNCVGNGCFTSNCANGLCFGGEFLPAAGCSLANPDTDAAVQYWQDPQMWAGAPVMPVPLTNDIAQTQDVQYLVEFLCMVPRDDLDSQQGNSPILPLYRITVRAEGEARRSSVSLQSVLRGTFL